MSNAELERNAGSLGAETALVVAVSAPAGREKRCEKEVKTVIV